MLSLLTPVLGVVGGFAVWWIRRPATDKPLTFAEIARKIIDLAAGLDDTDDVKHEFVQDLTKLLREYLAPVPTGPSSVDLMRTMLDDLRRDLRDALGVPAKTV